jgi:hypothetical protein
VYICFVKYTFFFLIFIRIFYFMQKHFYVPPEYDMVAIKRDAFKDMCKKHAYWRYEFKAGLKIQPGETPASVKARVEEHTLSGYNSTDVDILLERWCSEEYQVSDNLYWVLFSFIKTNVLGLNILNFNCVGIFCAHETIEVIERRATLHRVEELC